MKWMRVLRDCAGCGPHSGPEGRSSKRAGVWNTQSQTLETKTRGSSAAYETVRKIHTGSDMRVSQVFPYHKPFFHSFPLVCLCRTSLPRRAHTLDIEKLLNVVVPSFFRSPSSATAKDATIRHPRFTGAFCSLWSGGLWRIASRYGLERRHVRLKLRTVDTRLPFTLRGDWSSDGSSLTCTVCDEMPGTAPTMAKTTSTWTGLRANRERQHVREGCSRAPPRAPSR